MPLRSAHVLISQYLRGGRKPLVPLPQQTVQKVPVIGEGARQGVLVFGSGADGVPDLEKPGFWYCRFW